MRVYGLPTPGIAERDAASGIAQVVLNVAPELAKLDIELIEQPATADLIAHHAGAGDGKTRVAHCHGLYPTAMRGFRLERWHFEANRRVIQDLRAAQPHISVPSEWVADILRRDMKLEPMVIPWAVDTTQWQPGENLGYVLWNKNRSEGVCDPSWVNKLAERFPAVQFITTFGEQSHNVQVVGRVPHAMMKNLIASAGVYLATTKETGDIGSREAMACGVPVLGFRQGATADLVEHGKEGFLAEVGDFEGLCLGLEFCLTHRAYLSENALYRVQGYTWADVAGRFAQLYRRALGEPAPKISVVIPCYNYGRYITEALDSVFASVTDYPFEVIVVNDASTDHSKEVIEAYPRPIRKFHLATNGGVANARNVGIAAATGTFIVCLDADDKISPEFLQTCATALERDPRLGVVYTKLTIFNDLGETNANPWPEEYDAQRQLSKQNRIPSCCMFRQEAWDRVGGYRGRYTPAEDAEFWSRIALIGYDAKLVSSQGMFWYRVHEGSLSRTRKEPEWIKDKGYIEAANIPFACPAAPPTASWGVRNYDAPLVSVIIPVGPAHSDIVLRAVDSVERQSQWNWEVIVVNDSGLPIIGLPPYVREWFVDIEGGGGAGYARNRGLDMARGQFVVFLDADDELHPDFLQKTLTEFKYSGAYVYTDMILVDENGGQTRRDCPEFSPKTIFERGAYHAVTCLVPTHLAQKVRFDENMPSYEDVGFYMGMIAEAGFCGKHLPEPLLYYYVDDGTRRVVGNQQDKDLRDYLQKRYPMGDKTPMCSCMEQAPIPSAETTPEDADLVLVQYMGPEGNHAVKGFVTGNRYGRWAGGDTFYVDRRDLDFRFAPVQQVQMPQRQTLIPEVPYA